MTATLSARPTQSATRHHGSPGRGRSGFGSRRTLTAFFAGDDLDGRVRSAVGASWRRSAAASLRHDLVEAPFRPHSDAHGPLVRTSRPLLDDLASDLVGTGVSVFLADERGQIVDCRTSDTLLGARLERIRIAPGYLYAEHVVGTNGIGTSLVERAPVWVDGEEHFADALVGVACAAAPITDPASGRIVGVLALICLAGHQGSLMLPFAMRAARQIEQRLVDDAGIEERLVLQRFLQERRRAKGPFVVITKRTMLKNAAADRLITRADEPALRDHAIRALTGDDAGVSTLALLCGTTMTVQGEPIRDGNSAIGAILRLRPAPAQEPGQRGGRGRARVGWESLTSTEVSIVDLVSRGLTNQETGERLFLSRHTVGSHLRSIFRKLSVTSRVELARIALEQRVSAPPAVR